MKNRAGETAVVRSLHPALAPVGATKHMTPDEANLMVLIGRAEHAQLDENPKEVDDAVKQETVKDGTYKHRMMTAKNLRKRGGK